MPAGGSSPIPNPAPAASTFGGPRQARGPSRRNKNASAREGRDGSRTVPTALSRYAALRGLLNRLHGTKEICAPSRPQGILCHPKANLAILRTFGERWEPRSKRHATAAFRVYGLVSVCGIWQRKRDSVPLSPRAVFGVSFLIGPT